MGKRSMCGDGHALEALPATRVATRVTFSTRVENSYPGKTCLPGSNPRCCSVSVLDPGRKCFYPATRLKPAPLLAFTRVTFFPLRGNPGTTRVPL